MRAGLIIGLGIAGALVALVVRAAPKETPAPSASVTLDPGLDPTTAAMVQKYLTSSSADPNEVSTFASKLQAAGYPNSAVALRAKAISLRPLI
ncbi:MAG: hypothetical protein ACHREM_31040 [Polyangiales bacterium]